MLSGSPSFDLTCGAMDTMDQSAVDPAIISSLDLDVARHVVVNPLYAHLSGAVGIRGNFVVSLQG